MSLLFQYSWWTQICRSWICQCFRSVELFPRSTPASWADCATSWGLDHCSHASFLVISMPPVISFRRPCWWLCVKSRSYWTGSIPSWSRSSLLLAYSIHHYFVAMAFLRSHPHWQFLILREWACIQILLSSIVVSLFPSFPLLLMMFCCFVPWLLLRSWKNFLT